MRNPWEEIALSDYENHMSLSDVRQLQLLNELTGKQLSDCGSTVMILGVAGGNGLEHIDRETTRKVYGVDINRNYLTECRNRYRHLGDVLETICADLLDEQLHLPRAELLIANLLVEYIGYTRFREIVRLVDPACVSCVIQIDTGESFVSDSPYLHAFDRLDEIHVQLDEHQLTECMAGIHYRVKQVSEHPLPNGKKLVRIDFVR